MNCVKIMFVIGIFQSGAFALPYQSKVLHVFNTHALFQEKSDAIIATNESVAKFLGSLEKGTSAYPKKYRCDVKSSPAHFSDLDGGVMYYADSVYDIKNCIALP